jgi:Family of unknown function (DUF6680)
VGIPLQIWIGIFAIITGPTSALLIGKYIEDRRAKRNRRTQVFHSLMSNRASRLSPAWVQALNGIETEFYGDKKVIEAWRVLVDHLNSSDANDVDLVARWTEKLGDVINDLLFEMGKSLGYHFDKVTLKRNAYYPRFWGEVELEQHAIRKKFLEVLDGKRRLPIATFEDTFPPLTEPDTPVKK